MPKKTSYIEISERRVLLRVIDSLIIIASITIASLYFSFSYIDIHNTLVVQWFFLLIVFFLFFGEVFQLYNLRVSNSPFLVVRSVFITTLATLLLYVLSPFISPSLPSNRMQIAYSILWISIPVILWRFVYMWSLFSPKYFKTIIVIGSNKKTNSLLKLINLKKYHNVAAYFSDEEINKNYKYYDIKKGNLKEIIKEYSISELVISTSGFDDETVLDLNNQLVSLFKEGINIKSFETYYEEVTDRIPKEYLDHNFYKNINFSKNIYSGLYQSIHSIFNFILSIFGLLLFAVFLPFILIGNLFGNRGSLFYKQERVGTNGKHFKIVKLRSMIPNAEKNGAVWAKKNDKRVTTFGKFLRNTRLDEMPQFYNILKGDMSLIGPRPERPEFVQQLEKDIPFYAIRHVVKPGLTGWAQVNYPYANSLEEQEIKLRYDLYYIKERSTFLDFKILIKTITTVLFFRGQ